MEASSLRPSLEGAGPCMDPLCQGYISLTTPSPISSEAAAAITGR